MKIDIRVKGIASRRPALITNEFEISDGIETAEDLIEDIVRRNVRAYNDKAVDAPIFRFLTADEIGEAAKTGKVGFSDRNDDRAQDENAAVDNALQSYRDGLFKLFLDGADIESAAAGLPLRAAAPATPAPLREGSEILFVRLSMLSGRLW